MTPPGPLQRWREWVIRESVEVISQLRNELDTHPPPGWRSEFGPAELIQHVPGFFDGLWFIHRTDHQTQVYVSIVWRRPDELKGGDVRVDSREDLTTAAALVGEFITSGLEPAARRLGVSITWTGPFDQPMGRLPFDVGDRLSQFATVARKRADLEGDEADRWHRFVIAAHQERVAVDPDELKHWFHKNGWTGTDAERMTARFYDDCRLLARYADEVSAA